MRPDTEFSDTLVVPRLSAPQRPGKNIVYCATFRMAWQALCRSVGGAVALEDVDDFLLKELAAPLPDGLVDEDSAFSWVGLGENADLEGLHRAIDQRGGEQPGWRSPSPDMLLLYSLLSKKLAYPVPFRPAPYGVHFRGTPVEGFGLGDEGIHEEQRAMARQVLVHHSAPPDEAVLELVTTQPEDRVLIAQVEPGRTLKETASRVLTLARGEGTPLEPGDQLAIPCVDVAIARNYRELAGRKLKNAGGSGLLLSEAQQDIQLRLDARGAEVKSAARLGVACAAPPRAFYFTRPFVVLLARRGGDEPYLVVWVQTPELLVPLAAPPGGGR